MALSARAAGREAIGTFTEDQRREESSLKCCDSAGAPDRIRMFGGADKRQVASDGAIEVAVVEALLFTEIQARLKASSSHISLSHLTRVTLSVRAPMELFKVIINGP